jgi:hypothetical protein
VSDIFVSDIFVNGTQPDAPMVFHRSYWTERRSVTERWVLDQSLDVH